VDTNVKIKKMKKIIKLTEDDLTRIIKRVIRETDETQHQEPSAELIASLSSDAQDTEKGLGAATGSIAGSLYDDDISKVKKCFADVKKLGPLRSKIEFPTSCSKDLNSTCIEDIKIQISRFMGASQKSDSLIKCLKKVGKLKDPLSKWEESIS
jgi:hypothetical protein